MCFVRNIVFSCILFWSFSISVIAAEWVNFPDEFNDFPVKSYMLDSGGNAKINLDLNALWESNEKVNGQTYYVSWNEGSDKNNGLSPNLAFKTIKHAISQEDVYKVKLMPGIHFDGFDSVRPKNNIVIEPYNSETATIRMGEDPLSKRFTTNRHYSNVYEATFSRTIRDVIFKNGEEYVPFEAVQALEEVDQRKGSWWYDQDQRKLHIRTINDSKPNDEILLITTSQNIIEGDVSVFFRNIKIVGGNHGIQLIHSKNQERPKLYMLDSQVYYAQNFGISSIGGITYLKNVAIVDSASDNLNYHNSGSFESLSLEVDCLSKGAGRKSIAENANASSMHKTGRVIRVNGKYSESYGPNIADTDGSFSFNVGVYVSKSKASTSGRNINFLAGHNAGGGTMWCYNCVSVDSNIDYQVMNSKIVKCESNDLGRYSILNTNSLIEDCSEL